MTYDTGQVFLEAAKLILLPALGFLAGFASQWLLQERKSRDELIRALAQERAEALRKLWEITTLPAELAALGSDAAVPASLRQRIDTSVLDWYTAQAGALYLSWTATQLLFRFLDLLRSGQTHKTDLEQVVSSLRSRLKLDCGIYSGSDARRKLTRPRPSPWTADPSFERTATGTSAPAAHVER